MRLASFRRDGRLGLAASDGGEFHGLDEGEAGFPGTLMALLERGADLPGVGAELIAKAPVVDLSLVARMPPLFQPGKIICIGLNYRDHSAELAIEPPSYPTVFARYATSLTGHDTPLRHPVVSDQFDYEGEMAVVIGKGGRGIARENALDHVAGYSLFNDASVRDYQFKSPQWTVGKNFDATGAFGPWLVTADALPPGGAGLTLTTTLNDVEVQRATTDDMIFDVASLIVILSEAMTLEPGDVIVSGTPSGVGVAREPKLFMKPGDRCVVAIDRIGTLSNPVV